MLLADRRSPLSHWPMLLLAVLVTLGVLALASVMGQPIIAMYAWLGVIGLTLGTLLAFFGGLLGMVLVWLVLVACFHEEFWRLELAGFFNPTIPRLAMVALIAIGVAQLLLGRIKLKSGGSITWVMAAIVVYFTLSAAAYGFESKYAYGSSHYRLFGGYIFPFLIFYLVLQGFSREPQIRLWLWGFFFFGLYLTFIGWMETLGLYQLVWPTFIADEDLGIHFGRARGPFLVAAVMGIALVYVFYNNVLLARNVQGVWRLVIYATLPLTAVAAYFTFTRSVWTAFLAGGIVWLLAARRRLSRAPIVLVTAAVVLVTAVALGDRLAQDNRFRGGWTDMEPIYARIGLAESSMKMWLDNPVFGVGFGRFREIAPQYIDDPVNIYLRFSQRQMEHNNFLGLLATTGTLGALLYVGLLLLLLRESIRLWKTLPAVATGLFSRDFVVLYWVMYANFLIDATFRETSVAPFANSLFFGMSGFIVAMNRLLADDSLPVESRRMTANVPPQQLPSRSGSGTPPEFA